MKMKPTLPALLLALLFMNAILVTPGYQVGDKVKDFNLKGWDGKSVSLQGIPDAKGVILVFTCNTCPFAVAYEDRIVALHNKYAGKGYPVVAINPNDLSQKPEDSFEGMKKRAADKKFTFHYLRDDEQEVAKQFGATKTPHVYILNKTKEGFVVEYIGAIDDNSYEPAQVKTKYAENALDELLAGKKVTTSTTKAIGCSIKWKNS